MCSGFNVLLNVSALACSQPLTVRALPCKLPAAFMEPGRASSISLVTKRNRLQHAAFLTHSEEIECFDHKTTAHFVESSAKLRRAARGMLVPALIDDVRTPLEFSPQTNRQSSRMAAGSLASRI